MADSEMLIGGATLAGGEVGGGAKAMVGGSLPPRKRLLAGLKQNGLWPAASSQTSPRPPEITHGLEEGASEEVGIVEVSPSSETILAEARGSCMSCGVLESKSWRRVKRNGGVHRMCSSCAFSLNKSTSCLHCQAICPDVKDPSVWMQCFRCQRIVHLECQNKSSPSSRVDSDSSVCFECRQVKIQTEIGTALLGASAPGYVGIVDVNCCLGSGNLASSVGTESLSPRNKKLRVAKDARSGSSWKVAGDADVVERMSYGSKAAVERRRPTSQEISVAAAEEMAALAGVAAAKAKATAAVKAAAAIKAAAVAKAALDAAALAARADAQVRAEFCRSSWFLDHCAAVGGSQHGVTQIETRKERVEKDDVKVKREEIPGVTQSSAGDEELARQLHRVINSSPRISRSLAPLRRKSAGQPGAISSLPDLVRVLPPRPVSSSPAEPRLQTKQPRSSSQKDVKPLEPKLVNEELKTVGTNFSENSSQQPVCPTAADDAERLGTLKLEPADPSAVTLMKKESVSVQLQSSRGPSPEVLMKTETGQLKSTTERFFGFAEGNDLVLPASALSQASTRLDEVPRSEASVEESAEEGCQSRSRKGMSPTRAEERFHPILPGSNPESTQFEGQAVLLGIYPGDALAQASSSGADMLDPLDVSRRGESGEGRWGLPNDGNELEPDPDSGHFDSLIVKIPPSRSDELPLNNLVTSAELEDCPSESLSQLGAENGKLWQRGKSKGAPGGCQGFSSGVRTSSSSSASPIPIRTP